VNSYDICPALTESLPIKDGCTHRPNEWRLGAGEHLCQLHWDLSRRNPEPIDRSNLSQWMKNREQPADLLFSDSASDQIQSGNLPDLGDLAGNHAAERRPDQSIAIVDPARVTHRACYLTQASLPRVTDPIVSYKILDA
jgi:hypothetical protein